MDDILRSSPPPDANLEEAIAVGQPNTKSSKRRSKTRSKVWEKVAWFTRKTRTGKESKNNRPESHTKSNRTPNLQEICAQRDASFTSEWHSNETIRSLTDNSNHLVKTKSKSSVKKTRSFNYLKRRKLKQLDNELRPTVLEEEVDKTPTTCKCKTATGTFHDFVSERQNSRLSRNDRASSSNSLLCEMAREINFRNRSEIKENIKISLSLPMSSLSLNDRLGTRVISQSCNLPSFSSRSASFSEPAYNSWPRKKRTLVESQSCEILSPPQKQKRTIGLRKTATFSGFDSSRVNVSELGLRLVNSTPFLSGHNQIKNQNGLTVGVIHFFKSPRKVKKEKPTDKGDNFILVDDRHTAPISPDELRKLDLLSEPDILEKGFVEFDIAEDPTINTSIDKREQNFECLSHIIPQTSLKENETSSDEPIFHFHKFSKVEYSQDLATGSSLGAVASMKECFMIEDESVEFSFLSDKNEDAGCHGLYPQILHNDSDDSNSVGFGDADCQNGVFMKCKESTVNINDSLLMKAHTELYSEGLLGTAFAENYAKQSKWKAMTRSKDIESYSHNTCIDTSLVKEKRLSQHLAIIEEVPDGTLEINTESEMVKQSKEFGEIKIPSLTFVNNCTSNENQKDAACQTESEGCDLPLHLQQDPEYKVSISVLDDNIRTNEENNSLNPDYCGTNSTYNCKDSPLFSSRCIHVLGQTAFDTKTNSEVGKIPVDKGWQERQLKKERPKIEGLLFKEHTEAILQLFSAFNDEQKNIMIRKILERCDLPQMHLLSVVMEPILHQTCPSNCQDMLAWLPHNVTFVVMSYLDPVTLCRCSEVNRLWNSLAINPMLWQKLCRNNEWQLSRTGEKRQYIKYTLPSGTVQWKKMFAERFLLRRNWLNGRCKVRTFEGHTQGISCVQFDDTRIVSGSSDKTIKVWDLSRDDASAVLTLAGHSGTVRCLNLNGNRLVSGSVDRSIKVWDLSFESYWSGASCKVTMVGHMHTVRCLQVDDEKVVSGSYDKTLKVWDLKTGNCKLTLRGHNAAVLCVQFDDSKIVSGSYDNTIKVWSLDEGSCLMTLTGHHDAVTCLNLTLDGRKVISGSLDHNLKFWDLATGKCIGTLDWIRSEGHTGVVRCLQSDSWRIVSAGDDKTLKMWSLESGQRLLTLRCHTDGVTCLQFNDYRIVSGSYDKTVKVWDFSPQQDLLNTG